MRKSLVFLVALFFVNCGYSQVRFGLKAGGNLANIEDFDQSKMKIGISAGPTLQINLAEMFFIQPELLYSIKGARTEATQSSTEATLNLNYVNLPILLAYRAAPNFSIKLGPEIGRLLSAKSEVDGGTVDLSDIYEKFDFGANLGLAYSFKKLALDLRYNYGLKELTKGVQTDTNGTPTGEENVGANRVLQFSLCYFFK